MRRVVAVALLAVVLMAASVSLSFAGYAKTITVSAIGGDFTTVAAAVSSITDASATNRYLVQVYPGTYEGQVPAKAYVDIVGQGRNSVILTSSGAPWSATMYVTHHQYVASMTITATGAETIGLRASGAAFSRIENISVEANESAMIADAYSELITDGDRESVIDQWVTFHDCAFKGNKMVAHLSDFCFTDSCTFTMNTASTVNYGLAIELGGNAIMRNCLVNITLTGPVTGTFGAIQHTDYAYPTRLERTTLNLRATNPSATATIIGIQNGIFGEPISGRLDVDQCSLQVINEGSGTTYEICNAFNHPDFITCAVFVCATRYNADRSYGDIFAMPQGDISVRNIEVTGNLTVTGDTTIVLPDKDRTRIFPIFVTGSTVGFRKILGDASASPAVGYSFPDTVTLKRVTAVYTSPGLVWQSDANPEGQVAFYKNDQFVGATDLVNSTGGTATLSCTWPMNVQYTPQDKLSLTLEGIGELIDVSIVMEYTVE